MQRALIVALLAAAWLPPAFDPALAQPDIAKHRLLIALEKMASPRANPSDPLVTRNATVNVTGQVRIASAGIVGPIFCSVQVSYFDPNTDRLHSEAKTDTIAVSGNVGTCRMSIPFRWEDVTDFLNMQISIEVTNALSNTSVESAAAQPVLRTADLAGPSLPLPLEGETVHITFDTRI